MSLTENGNNRDGTFTDYSEIVARHAIERAGLSDETWVSLTVFKLKFIIQDAISEAERDF